MQRRRCEVSSGAALRVDNSHKTLVLVSTTDRMTTAAISALYTDRQGSVAVRIRSYYAYKQRVREDSDCWLETMRVKFHAEQLFSLRLTHVLLSPSTNLDANRS
jgi:hypothetical protein